MQLFFADRKPETASLAGLRFHVNLGLVGDQNSFDQCQPQTGTALSASRGTIQLMKEIKDFFLLGGIDANTVILHGKEEAVRFLRNSDQDFSPGVGKFDGIIDQVIHYPGKFALVSVERFVLKLNSFAQGDILFRGIFEVAFKNG